LAENHLNLYAGHTNATTERLGIPKILLDDALTFHTFASLFHQNDNTFEALLWRLSAALFDEIPLDISSDTDPQKKEWIANLRRKMKVGDWLQSAVNSTIEQVMLDGGATPIAKVFALLTGNQVERACQVAMDAGDFHLATLLSQIGGDKKFRDTMWRQWEIWVKEATDVFIDEDYRKVYAVLAGETTLGVASKSEDPFLRVEKVDISKGLDWKRIFALHLWYTCRMEDPVTMAVELYDETASERAAAARGASADDEDVVVTWVNPPPWYHKSSDPESRTGSHIGDPLLHLLRLFQDKEYLLSDTLAPLCYSRHPLDYRLPWHLFTILKTSLGLDEASHDFKMLSDQLTISYAMQLESFGIIDHSVFVLLHLTDPLW
jgi:nuclear pore complex protein Nup98-Nup96